MDRDQRSRSQDQWGNPEASMIGGRTKKRKKSFERREREKKSVRIRQESKKGKKKRTWSEELAPTKDPDEIQDM